MIMRIQRILSPTDFSAKSDEALRYAVALARAYEGKVFVFHCLRPFGTESNGEAERERAVARDRIRKHFENSVAACLNPGGLAKLEWEGTVVEGENPGDANRS